MWYESALVATVTGTVLGFALAFVPSLVRSRREKRSLVALLNGEIDRIVKYCDARRSEYVRYRDMISDGGTLGVYYSDRDMDTIFVANRGAIPRLDPEYANRVAQFYSHVADFKARAGALSESLHAHNSGTDTLTDKRFFVGSLEKMIESLSSIVEEGQTIVESST